MAGRRLSGTERRSSVLDAGAALFAERAYDDVLMEDVAERAEISRALLYRHFPSKRDLFAGVYARAAAQLLDASPIDDELPLLDQVRAGLDAHLDWFEAHRLTVLTANRTLAGDPTVQAIITDELGTLRTRMSAAIDASDSGQELVPAIVMSWLVFVRALSVEWLSSGTSSRHDVREACLGALCGALDPVAGHALRDERRAGTGDRPAPR